mgnify:FL=1
MQLEAFINQFESVIQPNSKISVVSHVNPDGDAIGSSLAMMCFLRKFGHEVKALVPNAFPEFLAWMPGACDILNFESQPEETSRWIAESDCVIMQDFNSLSRCGMLHNEIGKCRVPRILIDHHREPDLSQYSCALSETKVSSTSELVAEIVLRYGFDYLDEHIATDLLVGIMTDTGSFSHAIYHPRTFEIVGELLKKSAPYNEVHRYVYDTFSEGRLRLLGYAINKMEVLDAYSTAIIALDKDELDSFDYQVGDTEGIVNYPLSLKKMTMSVIITERQPGVVRFSFRSKGAFSVHELSNKHFNGGGHTNAAGGTLDCSVAEAVAKLKSVLPEYEGVLNS